MRDSIGIGRFKFLLTVFAFNVFGCSDLEFWVKQRRDFIYLLVSLFLLLFRFVQLFVGEEFIFILRKDVILFEIISGSRFLWQRSGIIKNWVLTFLSLSSSSQHKITTLAEEFELVIVFLKLFRGLCYSHYLLIHFASLIHIQELLPIHRHSTITAFHNLLIKLIICL